MYKIQVNTLIDNILIERRKRRICQFFRIQEFYLSRNLFQTRIHFKRHGISSIDINLNKKFHIDSFNKKSVYVPEQRKYF